VKRREKERGKTQYTLRVYTFSEAQDIVPYLTSIVRSLREHALEGLAQRRTVEKIDAKSGRATRDRLIARQEALAAVQRAEEQFGEAEEELRQLDIFSLDPLQGQSLVPFVHEDQLAWYIFDLHDGQLFRFWRYQSDPEEMRRPLTGAEKK